MLSPSSCHPCVWMQASPLIFTNVAASTVHLALSLFCGAHTASISMHTPDLHYSPVKRDYYRSATEYSGFIVDSHMWHNVHQAECNKRRHELHSGMKTSKKHSLELIMIIPKLHVECFVVYIAIVSLSIFFRKYFGANSEVVQV